MASGKGGGEAYKRRQKARMFREQSGRCRYCGRPMRIIPMVPGAPVPPDAATFDHEDPRVLRGPRGLGSGNVVLACRGCNLAKRVDTAEEFLARLRPRRYGD